MAQAIIPSISGMVKIPEAVNQFLVTHDAKGIMGPRLGVIDIQKDGPRYQEVEIRNWPLSEALPNDVEGICTLPERPREYLLLESGFYQKKFGRVIKIRYPGGAISGAEYLGSFQPFAAPPQDTTPRHEELEGIAVVAYENITVLLLARRGGREKPDDPVETIIPGQLIWGSIAGLHAPNPRFTRSGSAPLSHQKAIADRGAADLYVKQIDTNKWQVFSVATSDPGDLGPFRSSVYSAGTITIEPPKKILFEPEKSEKIVHWDFEGLKVEAVAVPAELFGDKSGLSIATDDETYHSIWRPIQISTETRSPSRLLFVENAKQGFSLK